jgi:hypothetical protein
VNNKQEAVEASLIILLWHLSESANGRAKNVKLGRRYLDQDSKQAPPE